MKNTYLLILLTIFPFWGHSQNYEMDLVDGQTINTCVGVFHDSETDLNSNFNGDYEYGTSENFTVTFCSDNATNANIFFTNLGLAIGENDSMYIYDGANSSAAQVAGSPFTNGNFNDLFIIGTGTCLTINFVSDAVSIQPSVTQLLGWHAYIGCGNAPNLPTIHDCLGAVPLCENSSHFNSALNETGIFSDEINAAPGGCIALEDGGVWYTFTPLSTGTLNFSITPDAPEDYDWDLFDLTDVHCDSLFLGDPLDYLLSSNTAGDNGLGGNFNQGPTGINSGSSISNTDCAGPGAGDGSGVGPLDWNGFNSDITVVAGNTYFIYVAQFSGTTGYTIDFSGSTANLFDATAPTLNPITNATCNTIDISFSEDILCSSIQNNDFTITGPGGPYTVSSISSVACNQGLSAGSAYTLVVSPALVNGNYTLELNATLNGSVEDACGNILITSTEAFVVINCNCSMTMTIDTSNPTCFESNDGDINLNVSNITGIASYSITNSSGVQLNTSALSPTANNLEAGWYYYSVTDDLCTISDSVLLTQPGQLAISYTVLDPNCYGIADGMVFVDTVENYLGSYDQIIFQWSQGALGVDLVTNDTLYNIGENIYYLTITDSASCQDVINFTVTYPDSIYFNDFVITSAICRNQVPFDNGNAQISGSASGGSNGNGQGTNMTHVWTNVTTGEVYNQGTTVTNLNSGQYTLTATNDLGCVISETITVDSLSPVANFNLTSSDFTSAYEGTAIVNIELENTSTNYAFSEDINADTTFVWTFGFEDETPLITSDINEILSQQYLKEGIYQICLTVIENFNGCKDSLCQEIIIHDVPGLVVPNVFTPGTNDDINNEFFFPNSAIIEFTCSVFDRWGKQVYQFNSINDKWDGTNYKNQKPCSDGVYFYIYSGDSSNGTHYEGQGNIHLIRKD